MQGQHTEVVRVHEITRQRLLLIGFYVSTSNISSDSKFQIPDSKFNNRRSNPGSRLILTNVFETVNGFLLLNLGLMKMHFTFNYHLKLCTYLKIHVLSSSVSSMFCVHSSHASLITHRVAERRVHIQFCRNGLKSSYSKHIFAVQCGYCVPHGMQCVPCVFLTPRVCSFPP